MVLQDKSIIRIKDIQWKRLWIPLQKKWQPAVQSPEKYYFTVSNRWSSKIITAYVWHIQKLINEQCDSISCAKKQDDGA